MSDYALKLSDAEVNRYRMMAQAALAAERDLWQRAGIREGATVADVGCGPGAISAVIAELVGPTGEVWAVDREPEALQIGESDHGVQATQAGGAAVRYRQGDATATGLEPGRFDTVMLRHVLAHNGGQEQAIVDHLATLVRPGGCVYLCDTEMTAIRVRPPQPDLDDLTDRYSQFHGARGNDPSVGLRLGELLSGAGLDLVEHRGRYDIIPVGPGMRPPAFAARAAMVEAGVASEDDFERWEAAFEAFDRSPEPATIFVPLFCAIGRR